MTTLKLRHYDDRKTTVDGKRLSNRLVNHRHGKWLRRCRVAVILIVLLAMPVIVVYWIGDHVDSGEPWIYYFGNAQSKLDMLNVLFNANTSLQNDDTYASLKTKQLLHPKLIASPIPDTCSSIPRNLRGQLETCYVVGNSPNYSFIEACEQSKTKISWVVSKTSRGPTWYGIKRTGGCPVLGDPGSIANKPKQSATWSRNGFPSQ